MKSTDLGVFLHRSVYSDSSLIVWFYTRESGLQKFLFRGGKKKAHSLYPLAVCELSFYGHKDADLLNLTSVESAQNATFQFNPIAATIAFFCVECVKKSVHLDDKDESIFQFLVHFSERLNSEKQIGMLPVFFLVEFSEYLGLKPYLEDENGTFLNLDAGVFQSSTNAHERIVYGDGVNLLYAIAFQMELPETVSKQTREEALNIMLEYFKIHVPRFDHLDTLEVVKEILYT